MTVVAHTVLVVEDEPKLREIIRGYLERAGLAVLTTGSGAEALRLVQDSPPDLVVLDRGLPDVSGDAVAEELAARGDVRILMLTARAEEADRIRGLELGADDYLVKPFSPKELVLRVQAVLRRAREPVPASSVVAFGGGRLRIDESRREVRVVGTLVELSPTEWALLLTLARVPGRVYSRAELMNSSRGHEFAGYERSVDSHVRNLRRKIEPDRRHPVFLLTVLGAGYRLGVTRDPTG